LRLTPSPLHRQGYRQWNFYNKFGNNEFPQVGYDRVQKKRATQEEFDILRRSIHDLGNLNIFFNENTRISVYQLSRVANKWKNQFGLDIIYVDYIQLLSGDKSAGTREREVASITKELKSLSQRLDIPVIGLSQLNREVGTSGAPKASNLRESSALEHDANKVILMWRPWMFDRKNPDWSINDAEVFVVKNREGESGQIKVHFNDILTLFSDRSRNENDFYGSEDVPF